MKNRACRYFVADFETTVFEGQTDTQVWAAASVELFDQSENVIIHHSLPEQFDYFCSLHSHLIVYYHNLKFDGSFILSYLLINRELKQALYKDETGEHWLKDKDMKNGMVRYSISDMGQWYSIIAKINDCYIEFRDSLKLLPFSVKELGKSFGTKHKKLEMEYKGFRYPGCEITEEEQHYIANDVLVVKEALEIMFEQGHQKMTIGSCCLDEYKKLTGYFVYKDLFPDLYKIGLDKNIYDCDNAGEYIRRAYRGGWCYYVKGKENMLHYNGFTADVNSLYPSVMSSESGSFYPVGEPTFWSGDTIPFEARGNNRYYFVRFRCRFRLRDGYLPFIQIKNNMMYKATECLTTSDIYDWKTGEYYPYYYDTAGNLVTADVVLTCTCTDFVLIQEHYELLGLEILDGCWFKSRCGIFDKYIEKYKKIKMESKGAIRTLAKLFLNNLYGKMSSSPDSSFKVADIKENGALAFRCVPEFTKKPGYIAVGAAITSYARNFTIRAAQQNFYGVDKPGFIYADTDSIHCDIPLSEVRGIKTHDTAFCCWKIESCWDIGLFVRQKTYIEHQTMQDMRELEEPVWDVKCAGMPERCKSLFIKNIEGYEPKENEDFSDEERKFLSTPRTLEDFKVGLTVPGKLLPKRIPGGVLLCETTFEMREN